MLTLEIIIVSLVLLFIIISLYTNLLGPAFTLLIGVLVLGLFRILTPEEILSGLANEQVLVIILLLMFSGVVRQTGIVERIFERIFRKARTYRGFLLRMTLGFGSISAFINNTPLVAILMPYVNQWALRNKIRPSKVLIPLSYAIILGGTVTLIGTSTNLMINGMVTNPRIIPGLKPLGLFDFTLVGLPMLILGCLYLVIFGKKLLPDRRDVLTSFDSSHREYLVEAQIRSKSPFIGKTIEDANLRNLPGLYLVEINREGVSLPAISPAIILEEGDILVFAGETDTIAELIKSTSGLMLTQVGMFTRKARTEVLELVISHNSTLVNKTVRQANFRGLFDAAILAIHRNGERIPGKIGDVKLKAGDVLLVMAGDDFNSRGLATQDFYLISKVREFRKLKWYHGVVLLGGIMSAVLLSALGLVSFFMALIILMILLLALHISSPKDLPRNIDYNLGIIIVLSLALGTAMIKTGMASLLAGYLVRLFIPYGAIALLGIIFILTNVLGAYVSNRAASAIIYPISVTAAMQTGLPTAPFILIVAFGTAASFITPIGYQTNLMVYGPGGYNFRDYMKIGLPLTILYLIVSVAVLSWWYELK